MFDLKQNSVASSGGTQPVSQSALLIQRGKIAPLGAGGVKPQPEAVNTRMEEDAQAKQVEFRNVKSVVGNRVYSAPHTANQLAGVSSPSARVVWSLSSM